MFYIPNRTGTLSHSARTHRGEPPRAMCTRLSALSALQSAAPRLTNKINPRPANRTCFFPCPTIPHPTQPPLRKLRPTSVHMQQQRRRRRQRQLHAASSSGKQQRAFGFGFRAHIIFGCAGDFFPGVRDARSALSTHSHFAQVRSHSQPSRAFAEKQSH